MAVKSFQEIKESRCDVMYHATRPERRNRSPKHVTPFSIDDILSRREKDADKIDFSFAQKDNFNEALLSSAKSLFPVGDFMPWSTGVYPKWLENLHRLYATASHLQPFLLPVNLTRPLGATQLSAWYAQADRFPLLRQSQNNFEPWNSKKRRLSVDANFTNARRRRTPTPPHHIDGSHAKRHSDVIKNGASSMDDSSSECEEMQRTADIRAQKQNDNTSASDSPIHALEKLACSTFKGMEEKQSMLHSIAIGRQVRVKRRKCRTAFTSFQLSVLEQRFSCHKYLTPADRDQIAQALGLTAPQVITWFQNRRAKLKRDMEEMRNDLKTVNPYGEADDRLTEPCENASADRSSPVS